MVSEKKAFRAAVALSVAGLVGQLCFQLHNRAASVKASTEPGLSQTRAGEKAPDEIDVSPLLLSVPRILACGTSTTNQSATIAVAFEVGHKEESRLYQPYCVTFRDETVDPRYRRLIAVDSQPAPAFLGLAGSLNQELYRWNVALSPGKYVSEVGILNMNDGSKIISKRLRFSVPGD